MNDIDNAIEEIEEIEVIIRTTRAARIVISPTMLKQSLGLPIDANIVDIAFNNDVADSITIIVEHHELPETVERAPLLKVNYAVRYAELREFVRWIL